MGFFQIEFKRRERTGNWSCKEWKGREKFKVYLGKFVDFLEFGKNGVNLE